MEILKWDANEKCPVVYLNHNGFAYNVSADGMYDADPNHGLFFADEEEKLSEFEKAVETICKNLGDGIDNIGDIHILSNNLLDLARKKIEDEADELLFGMFGDGRRYADNDPRLNSTKQGYYLGKRDALKDLPKWKKGTPPSATTLYVIRKGYYMTIEEVDELFETLPKEE